MKKVRTLAAICSVAMLFSVSAFAQARGILVNADTNQIKQTVGEFTYWFTGGVTVDPDEGAHAGNIIINMSPSKKGTPNGYVKIYSYLYNETGVLVETSMSPYSRLDYGPANYLETNTKVCSIYGDYYASASALIYNPNTGNYDSFKTLNSPRLTYSGPNGRSPVNRAVALTSDDPSLIPAVATNGITGYIRAADLYSDFPESPLISSLMPIADKTLNVYAPGTNAVIGQFIVTVG